MMKSLKTFLDQHDAKYSLLEHSPTYTAQESADALHIPLKEFAKTVVVKIDGELAMVIEPANIHVNLQALQAFTGAKKVDLAQEYEFKDKFVDCEIGAMPPFGNLFGMAVYMSALMQDNENIVFNAGRHTELMKMKLTDFLSLVRPKLMMF